MKTVNFTEMKNGTKEEHLLLDKYKGHKYYDNAMNFCEKFK